VYPRDPHSLSPQAEITVATTTRPTRILIVDDSAVIREVLRDIISTESDMTVVAQASNGRDALAKLDQHEIDLVTLDVQMPVMDGLETLDAILAKNPVPVIMVSGLTQLGANVTFDALERGAIDYVGKPDSVTGGHAQLKFELVRKIRASVGVDVRRVVEMRKQRMLRSKAQKAAVAQTPSTETVAPTPQCGQRLVAIGISTGGPPALTTLFQSLRPPLPPIVIVQHMPEQFTKPLAWRLNSLAAVTVCEAEHGQVIEPNHAYIAPGGKHLALRKSAGKVQVVIYDGDPISGHKPSVDVMMKSAASIYGSNCLGVIMTGMGRDGADGCKAIRAAGGYVLGQDDASSDVYGMNKVALVEGGVDSQFSLDQGAVRIMSEVKKLGSGTQKLTQLAQPRT
jgi:two-component system chemotaxis response regulator CheB